MTQPDDTPMADEWTELEAKALAATPGPWNDSGGSVDDFDADCCMRMEWMPNGTPGDGDDDAVNANYRADTTFIAAADPATVLKLIAAARLAASPPLAEGGREQ